VTTIMVYNSNVFSVSGDSDITATLKYNDVTSVI